MPAADNDWRLTNQENYLKGAALTFRKYRRWSPTWDHDHCAFCTDKFMEEPWPEILTEGYCTLDEYHWICPTCFGDFRDRFGWKTVPSPTFRRLPGLPPYGPIAVPIPVSFARSGSEGVVVEFLPGTPAAWVGNFMLGLGGYTGVHVHPNGRDVIVFATGSAYVIDPAKPKLIAELPGSAFIVEVRRVTNPQGFVYDVQGLEFVRIGPEGLAWRTRRLSMDGFQNVEFSSDRITGLGLDAGCETWAAFEVDLHTGRSSGGLSVAFGDDREQLADP